MQVRIVPDKYVMRRGKKVLTHDEIMATTLDAVSEAIRGLSGDSCSMVTFIHDEDGNASTLCVSGGRGGLYFVTVTQGVDDAFFTLLGAKRTHDKDERNGDVVLVIGGQEVIKSRNELVDFDTATRAAEHWAECCELTPLLTWRRDR